MGKRFYGGLKDDWDERDSLHPTRKLLPTGVSLRPYIPTARSQGETSACVGFAIAGLLTATRTRGRESAAGSFTDLAPWFSPLWVYWWARLLGDCAGEDGGCSPRDALKGLAKRGCALEADWPFDCEHPRLGRPPASLYKPALEWPILSYARCVDGAQGIMSALASGHFVALGMPWFAKWEEPGPSGILAQVRPSDEIAGRHETFLFSYDQREVIAGGVNSWDEDWGAKGTYLMPFEALEVAKKIPAEQGGQYDAWKLEVDWGKA